MRGIAFFHLPPGYFGFDLLSASAFPFPRPPLCRSHSVPFLLCAAAAYRILSVAQFCAAAIPFRSTFFAGFECSILCISRNHLFRFIVALNRSPRLRATLSALLSTAASAESFFHPSLLEKARLAAAHICRGSQVKLLIFPFAQNCFARTKRAQKALTNFKGPNA